MYIISDQATSNNNNNSGAFRIITAAMASDADSGTIFGRVIMDDVSNVALLTKLEALKAVVSFHDPYISDCGELDAITGKPIIIITTPTTTATTATK